MTGAQIAARAARHAVIPRANPADRAFAAFVRVLMFGAIGVSLLALLTLLYDVARDGVPHVSWNFLPSFPSRIIPSSSGIESALYGTLFLMAVTASIVVPLGIASAIYLEEYADRSKWWNRLVEVNIQNLAAVPSVVYGILGLAFIVRGPLSLGRTVLAGGITLALLVLPVVIIVAR
jgi:phosphate transport system permease protein